MRERESAVRHSCLKGLLVKVWGYETSVCLVGGQRRYLHLRHAVLNQLGLITPLEQSF